MVKKATEKESLYKDLEKMETIELLKNMNKEDSKVATSVSRCINQVESLVGVVISKVKSGGRLFYIGAGTSGRLGIVDASECPPTFGVDKGLVVGLIAGGDKAIRNAVEFAEDDFDGGWNDLLSYNINSKDIVIGLSASGTTPYVVGAMQQCNIHNITTGCITCNIGSLLAMESKYPIEIEVGPEFVTGSTRMKAGTAQKLILNMITTTLMIKLGRIKGNKMVDMQLSNNKLLDRGTRMIMNELNINDYNVARDMLLKSGSVRLALESYK